MKFGRFGVTVLMLAGLVVGPALAQDAQSEKLFDGFDGQTFAPTGGLYYRKNAEQKAGTYTFQDKVKLDGTGALKLSVRSLCKPGDKLCSERAEIWEKTANRVPYDEPAWYGVAMKLADPIPQDNHRYLMAQWKREIGPTAQGDYSPFLALRLERGRMFFTVETDYIAGGPALVDGQCPAGSTRVWFRPKEKQMRALVATGKDWRAKDMADYPGCTDQMQVVTHNPLPNASTKWVNFAVLSHPDAHGKGHIEIFANKVWIATITGHIGHDDKGLGKNQYFKFGPYRAGHKGNWTVYYDDFRRSPDCMDVLKDEKACAEVK